MSIFSRDLRAPDPELTPTDLDNSSLQITSPVASPAPQDEERNRIKAIKELQKKAVSSQAYGFSPMKRSAVLECCEKIEMIIGRGYFQLPPARTMVHHGPPQGT